MPINFSTIYKITIKKALKRPLIYVLCGISIVCCLFVYVIAPLFVGGGDIANYYDSSDWPIFCIQISLITICLCSSFIGETNSINDEKLYFLSKNIKKNTFLFAKCFASLTLSLFITLIFSITLIAIFITSVNTWHFNIFRPQHGVNAWSIFGSFIALTIFGSFCGTIGKYQTHRGIPTTICCILLIIYIALFLLFTNNLSQSDIDDKLRFWWLVCPIIIFVPLTFSLGYIGFLIFNRKEVG